MKKVILLCGALLSLTAVVANAQLLVGVTDACTGVRAATWTCTANTGPKVTLAAAVTVTGAPALLAVTGNECEFEVAFSGGVVPAWWQMATGKCRTAGSYTVGTSPAGTCNNYFNESGSYSANTAMYIGPVNDPLYGPVTADRIRLNVVASIPDPTAAAQPVDGEQVYLFNIAIGGARTVGSPSCLGCGTGACAVLRRAKLTQSVGMGDPLWSAVEPHLAGSIQVPAVGTYLQGGGTLSCPRATPTNRSSWGQLKSLYR